MANGKGWNSMTMATATDVKNRFGEFMEKAQREPVTVEKTGRRYAVLMSYEEYERLQAMEDAYWAALADQAKQNGFASAEEVERLMSKL